MTGGGLDPRLGAAPTNFQQNQGGSGEGFLVPTEYREQIWALVFDDQNRPPGSRLFGALRARRDRGQGRALSLDRA
ncbi:hypothetical protein RX327_33250 [Bradyrhizobium sp. BEA-2-5]|uniref:hypothetical protein n=1 Tax=Bradyrhizobium sp. BEA-2-5 TaxID=3080015 RepID=UPI00293E981E|nr:hypothetical protein [Bradyrhizobium sp. BEA-2-5]WOH80585.1 hypothetical protein RX327_33250 [Bradyrhizobium sp. BEA-2-5]